MFHVDLLLQAVILRVDPLLSPRVFLYHSHQHHHHGSDITCPLAKPGKHRLLLLVRDHMQPLFCASQLRIPDLNTQASSIARASCTRLYTCIIAHVHSLFLSCTNSAHRSGSKLHFIYEIEALDSTSGNRHCVHVHVHVLHTTGPVDGDHASR